MNSSMSIRATIKALMGKKPGRGGLDPIDPTDPIGRSHDALEGRSLAAENENPYLAARRTWNDQSAANIANRQMWQLLGILSLMIALAGVGGMVYIGSQSKFVPYVVHAAVASFIADLRMVTPDIALQRKAVFRLYSMLSASDAATSKANEWLNGTPESSPFKRAAKQTVSTEIVSVIPQTGETWQVDWIETVRDRQGVAMGLPFRMRALVTVYTVAPTAQTTEEHMRNNPLGIYVRDFSWSKQV